MDFKILGEIGEVETFAVGSNIREIKRLRKRDGSGRWRKRKASRAFGYRTAEFVGRSYTGTRRLASVAASSRSNDIWIEWIMPSSRQRFVVCVRNDGYEVSLERRKIYQVLPDGDAARHGQIRIVDESGEDYLFPASYFAAIELSRPLRRALLAAA